MHTRDIARNLFQGKWSGRGASHLYYVRLCVNVYVYMQNVKFRVGVVMRSPPPLLASLLATLMMHMLTFYLDSLCKVLSAGLVKQTDRQEQSFIC